MPPAAATAAGRARKSRNSDAPPAGAGRPADRGGRNASAGQYVDEIRVTDRRAARPTAGASAQRVNARSQAAEPSARPSRRRRDRNASGFVGSMTTTPRKRREVHPTPSSETSAFERVLGPDQFRAASSRHAEPQPLMMAPRRRMPRMDTSVFNVATHMPTGIALPHIARPALRRPQVSRPTLRRPALAKPRITRTIASGHLDRIIRSRLWIGILGVMLVSIVAMRVEVLKLGTKTGAAVQQASQLQNANQKLQVDLSGLENPARLERIAARNDMVQPDSTDTRFITAGSGRNVNEAIRSISAPDASTFENDLTTREEDNGDPNAATSDVSPDDTAATSDAAGTVTGSSSNQ